VVQFAELELSTLTEIGSNDFFRYLNEARLHAYHGRRADSIAALEMAYQRGLRTEQLIAGVLFDDIREDPRVQKVIADMQRGLDLERHKALQMMCFANPVPGAWQPLPDTCKGVVREEST
jgi:hypothetical protein